MPQYDLIISHGNCYDGMTAAWVAWAAHGFNLDCHFAQHGDAPPDVRGKRVLISDFSYPREVLEKLNEEALSLLVLDHHKSAEAALSGLSYVEFDMSRSGAGMVWDHFHPGVDRPPIVAFVEDRDLWQFKYPETQRYHAAMTAKPLTLESIQEFSTLSTEEMVGNGETILSFSKLIAEKLASRASVYDFDGLRVWLVNSPVEFVGETADVLMQRKDFSGNYLPVLSWMYDGERGDLYCSLRSREDGPDVSLIATKYGGGGHAHAAGFRRRWSF